MNVQKKYVIGRNLHADETTTAARDENLDKVQHSSCTPTPKHFPAQVMEQLRSVALLHHMDLINPRVQTRGKF